MGPGKADLLEAIDREGSISAGGRALSMSYRRAWLLVDTMNRCFREPLVQTTPGGSPNAGARLTDTGRLVLAAFRGVERQAAEAACGAEMDTVLAALRAASTNRSDGAAA